jgi:hypothetical protein
MQRDVNLSPEGASAQGTEYSSMCTCERGRIPSQVKTYPPTAPLRLFPHSSILNIPPAARFEHARHNSLGSPVKSAPSRRAQSPSSSEPRLSYPCAPQMRMTCWQRLQRKARYRTPSRVYTPRTFRTCSTDSCPFSFANLPKASFPSAVAAFRRELASLQSALRNLIQTTSL